MSIDDSEVDYSPADWREKYNEVSDLLEQTRAELDDFHAASKELEAELESELQRTERAQKDLMVKVAKAESERDDWKSKFMSLQTTHNTTSTSLQRELDQLRHDHQQLKIQFRELEMGNDDLERNERAVSSSLADVEAKYSRALEEKILLEHELLDKANLEEECQRLRDELRDATEEASILKDKVAAATATQSSSSLPEANPSSALSSQDDLLKTPPPGDLLLSELNTSSPSLPSLQTTPKATRPPVARSNINASPSRMPVPSSNGVSRATTMPSIRTPTSSHRPTPVRNASIVSNASTSTNASTATTSKNKGVQMVSEMRARVKNLEQRIHTRVPRLRMGSITARANNANMAASTYAGTNGSINSNKSTASKSSWDSFGNIRRSVDSKKSSESESEKKPASDSTGWVLIMEDSPSPQKPKARERRRPSSPLAPPMPFRPSSNAEKPPSRIQGSPTLRSNHLGQSTVNSGIRRPGSRLSGASSLSSATTSSISTPTSRPSTPTLLPVPSGSAALKRSMGPVSSQAKRSSLGASTNQHPSKARDRPITMPPLPNGRRSSIDNGKTLPSLPSSITVRSAKVPKSGSAVLSKSRIGRPSGGNAPRRSFDEQSRPPLPETRPRSSSSAMAEPEEEIDETEMF